MDRNALRAEIARSGMKYEEVAKELGISTTTLWRRMQTGNFGLEEANQLIRLLGIKNPGEIFFGRN